MSCVLRIQTGHTARILLFAARAAAVEGERHAVQRAASRVLLLPHCQLCGSRTHPHAPSVLVRA